MENTDQNLLEKALSRRRSKLKVRKLLGSVGRYMPFSLKYSLARRSSKLAYLLLEDGDFILKDYLGSYQFKVNAKYEIQRVLISNQYEPDVLAIVKKWVHSGDYCIDVGANVGAVSFALAKQVGSSGRVLCIEPGPSYVERLKENMRLNPSLEDVLQVHQVGLSDKTGELFWGEDLDFPGNAYLLGKRGTPVPVTTLDRLLSENPIPKLHFMKIDIEGMEWEMLNGAIETLKKYQPVILYETRLEVEAARGLPVLKMTEDLLRSLHYEIYQMDDAGLLSKAEYPNYSPNTLAVPRGNSLPS